MELNNSFNKRWKKENASVYLEILKRSVEESLTISENTKKEVLQWLLTIDFDGSKRDSSCGRDCISTGSRKSGIRSRNNDLESNLETPIKRRKLSVPITSVGRKKRSNGLKNQPRIHQFFPKVEKKHLFIRKHTLSRSENLPQNPVKNTENLIVSRKDSYNDKTPERKSIPVNSILSKNIASTGNPSSKGHRNSETHVPCKENLPISNENVVQSSCIFQDVFMNNIKTEEESPDYSLHTNAISPLIPLQEKNPQTLPTVQDEEENHQKKMLGVCDSESDSDDSIFNFSDIDLDDIVPPVSTKLKIPVDSTVVKQRKSPHINTQQIKKSFLASLSTDVPLENADPKAVSYRSNYSSLKEELCKELYTLYNEKVFDNKLPKDMSIEWSVRLQRAAGKYSYSKSLEEAASTSRILLSTKILDSPNKLRDVLIHEMCHAATTLINNVRDGHGSFWKAWAGKAVEVFPELPIIYRCHSYETEKKFTYRCTCCGDSFGRHRRVLDINKKGCGYCRGPFEILMNQFTKAGTVQVKCQSQTREPKGFAVYVKENFHVVREREVSMKHAEVIKILQQQFSAIEVRSKQGN